MVRSLREESDNSGTKVKQPKLTSPLFIPFLLPDTIRTRLP